MTEISEPLHPDFQKILKQFIKRYGKEKGERFFWAWVNKLGLKPEKPYDAQVKEAFRWARLQGDEYYYCEAAFPIESMNRNVYAEEELIRAARTLIGRPVNLNHEQPLENVEIVDAEYEDGAVECIFKIGNEEIRRMIDEGEIIHVSIEADFREAEIGNGVKPKGLVFTGLALLTKNVLPGVPLTRIWKSSDRVVESFENFMLKEVEEEMSEKIEEQAKTCFICGRPASDTVTLGKHELHMQCATRFWELATEIFHLSERAVSPHETPKAPEEKEWNADAAEQRVRSWAGGPDKENVDWDKYRQAFAWYNTEDPENFGSYKLPHHDIVDGRVCVVWRGVAAAMAALLGARGGVDIPAADRRSVYTHLARHYSQFDREPPEFESALEILVRMQNETIEQQKQAIQNLVAEKKDLEEKLKAAKRQSRIILKL